MNEKLVTEIKSEIGICLKEVRKADNEILKATERHNHYEDRRIMLTTLLELAENEEKAESSENDKKTFCDIPGIRFDKATFNWEAHIRIDYVEYQLGYHGKGSKGLLSAISARKEAECVLNDSPEKFREWYSKRYPEYTPIDRKARGYSH